MVGEIKIFGVELRGLADNPFEDRALEIIDHDFGGHAAKKFQGVLMTGQPVLHGLGNGKFDIQHPAVAQGHHEKAEASAGFAHRDCAKRPPIHLGTFAGGKMQLQKGRSPIGSDLADMPLDGVIAATIAVLPDLLKNLHCGVAVFFQQTNDFRLERIEDGRL